MPFKGGHSCRGIREADWKYEKLTEFWFAQFVYRTLQQVLMECAMVKNKENLLFVMENDPSQRSAAANESLHEIGADLVEIPLRSPDLNPIENMFRSITHSLREGALRQRISREDFQSVKQRVLETVFQCDTCIINRTIESMNNHLQNIVMNGGYRTKY